MSHQRWMAVRLGAPHGITLLEVTLSTFVLTVGVLGVLILVPLGGVHMQQAELADRSATCGRAAFREIEARNMLRNNNWVNRTGLNNFTNFAVDGEFFYRRVQPPINPNSPPDPETFLIDPLFIMNINTAAGLRQASQFPFQATVNANLVMPRVTLRNMNRVQAEQVFRWRDDLIFAAPAGDRTARPQWMPRGTTSGGGLADAPVVQGDYSWMVMVTPAATEIAPSLALPPSTGRRILNRNRRMFHVSVIVLHKRDLPGDPNAVAPRERQVQLTSGGGNNFRLTDTAGVGQFAPNRWVLLSGFLRQPADSTSSTGIPQPTEQRKYHRWYRVAAVGKAPTTQEVVLKLDGPDWVGDWNVVQGQPVCTLVDGVAGVFERTIELDVRSLMSN
jgi:hypothetical protein